MTDGLKITFIKYAPDADHGQGYCPDTKWNRDREYHIEKERIIMTGNNVKRIIVSCLLAAMLACLTAMPALAAAEEDAESIYQVALLQSLVQGYYDGIITVGELKEHGDTGIGTFEGVNGEMIVLDGVVYQALADGSIAIPSDEETVPFSNVTFFDEDETLELSGISDMAGLQDALNAVVKEKGNNLFYMVRISGTFPNIKVRSEYKQEKPYRMLDEALASDQTEFDYENAEGTIVGLFCPDYMGGLNNAGWHFHYISQDLTRGGHVLKVSIDDAVARIDITDGFEMVLPKETGFQEMDLAKNVDEALHKAETAVTTQTNGN